MKEEGTRMPNSTRMSGTDVHGEGYFLLDSVPDPSGPQPRTGGYRVDDAPDFFEVEGRPEAPLHHTDGLDD
jgi:hypothetical protein